MNARLDSLAFEPARERPRPDACRPKARATTQDDLRRGIEDLVLIFLEGGGSEHPDAMLLQVTEAATACMAGCAFALGILRATPRAELADAVTRNLLVLANLRGCELRAQAGFNENGTLRPRS